jgi:hypothetical protein
MLKIGLRGRQTVACRACCLSKAKEKGQELIEFTAVNMNKRTQPAGRSLLLERRAYDCRLLPQRSGVTSDRRKASSESLLNPVIHFCFILFRRAPAAREELSGIVQPALHVRISKRKRTPPSLVMVMLRPHWLKTPGRRAGPVLETIENALRADQAKDDGC